MTCRRLTPRPLSRRCSARRPRLEIHVTDATPILLHSRIFAERGIPHAFTTRRGGVSRGVFESLNFGNPGDLPTASRDPAANIHANFGIVLGEIGCVGREVVQVHQIHGNALHRVRAGRSAHETLSDTKADGLITDDPNRILAVRVADCAPVLLASRDGRVVAAVHAGWRGVVAGIAQAAVDALRQDGAEDVIAAIGPCLSVEHFEIGLEVAAEFERVFGAGTPHLRPGAPGKAMLDMKGALRAQLLAAGAIGVDVLSRCTHGDHELFFSHRRDRGITGRMVGVIGPIGSG